MTEPNHPNRWPDGDTESASGIDNVRRDVERQAMDDLVQAKIAAEKFAAGMNAKYARSPVWPLVRLLITESFISGYKAKSREQVQP